MNKTTKQPRRSDEPIWWALFSAGGVCFAVVLPGALLSLAVLYPLGLISMQMLSYERIHAMVFDAFFGLGGLAFVGAAICLPLFHAVHRIHHGLHDLQWAHGPVAKVLCYGAAILLSAIALGLWVVGL
jgi:fumarate reductase subunit D